jgi:proteasome lid subunit RPN8/RPN11
MTTTDDVLNAIRRHGAQAYPEEGCGFLIGTVEDGDNHVLDTQPVANRRTENRERRYHITPEDYREANRAAADRGLDIVGFYHSHPDHPAEPSDTDLEEATFPGYTYVIVSVHGGTPDDITAWTLAPDRSEFRPETISVEQREAL